MLTRIAIVVLTTLAIGSASAAFAAPKVLPIQQPTCTTDEGGGRTGNCHPGGI